jgi:hypothetical protein
MKPGKGSINNNNLSSGRGCMHQSTRGCGTPGKNEEHPISWFKQCSSHTDGRVDR